MALENILSMIANPQTPNYAGSFGQGLGIGQSIADRSVQKTLLNQQQEQREKIEFANIVSQALASPESERVKLLQLAKQQTAPGSRQQVAIDGILSSPPEAQTQMLNRINSLSVQEGLIKPPAKAEKTAEQIEREIAEKEKTPAIKEFEYAEQNPEFGLQKKEKEMVGKAREIASKSFKNSMDLRKEFIGQSTDFKKVRDAYTRVKVSTSDPSPAGDLSLIFNYMKMLDPNSVVRESEFATAQNSGSVPQRVISQYNRVLSGERLSEKMRKDFIGVSAKLMGGIEKQHKKLEKVYTDIARKNDLDPKQVVVDFAVPLEAAKEKEVKTNDPLGIR